MICSLFGEGMEGLTPCRIDGRLRLRWSHPGHAMDPRITALRSTTFQGRRLTRRQLAAVQETVLSFPGLSRREVAHTICEQLHWHTAKGGNRIQAALRMLEELEGLGVLSLPAKDLSRVRGARKPVVWGPADGCTAGDRGGSGGFAADPAAGRVGCGGDRGME